MSYSIIRFINELQKNIKHLEIIGEKYDQLYYIYLQLILLEIESFNTCFKKIVLGLTISDYNELRIEISYYNNLISVDELQGIGIDSSTDWRPKGISVPYIDYRVGGVPDWLFEYLSKDGF